MNAPDAARTFAGSGLDYGFHGIVGGFYGIVGEAIDF